MSRTFIKVKDVYCVKDVLRQLDGACSGRTSCDVSVRSLVDLHPCKKDFVSYLEASYECIEGTKISLTTTTVLLLVLGGVVALSVECWTSDQEVVGSSLGRARGVKTLGKFLTPMCL